MNVPSYITRVQLAPSSKDTYKVQLNVVDRELKKRGIEFKDMDWDTFLDIISSVPSANTQRGYHAASKSYARVMRIDSPLLDKNNYIRRSESEPREGLSEDEFRTLLDTIDRRTLIGKRDAAMLLIQAGGGGYRSTELATLKVKHINLDELTVMAFRKGGRWHTAAITQEAADAIGEWMRVRPRVLAKYGVTDHGFLFVAVKSGQPLTRWGVTQRYSKELGPRIGRPDLQCHDMRRTMCILMIKNDAPDSVVMEQGNWSDHNSFKRYKRGICPADARKFLTGGNNDDLQPTKAG